MDKAGQEALALENLMTLSTDAIIGIVSTVLFSIMSFWIGHIAKRPRLKLYGSGSGGISVPNRDIMASYVFIYNHPFFFGFRVRREAATITTARIYDSE